MASAAEPFRFAWVNDGTAFNAVTHDVEDEEIVRFSIDQIETEFATLTVDIRNPRIGLLNAGRKLWAWLSWFDGATLVPLFFGRVVGIPSSLNKEVVTLTFIARPTNFGAQKEALAATMRTLPFFDPLFISEDNLLDPDVVLEGRTAVWHIDRTSHAVSTSDLLVGEDGLLVFTEDDVPYDSVDIQLDQPPIRTVHVEAAIPWTQSVAGEGIPFLSNYAVGTLAGAGLQGGWPKPGADMGGGWHATSSFAGSPYEFLTDADYNAWFGNLIHHAPMVGPMPFAFSIVSSFSASSDQNTSSQSTTIFAIIADQISLSLTMGYAADRQRKDTLIFDLIAGTQPIVTMPEDDARIDLIINGNSATDINPDVVPPVVSQIPATSRAYFTTARGMQSILYLIGIARANIVVRSRAVKVPFKCKFDRAIELSLRKNALLYDRRLPGGQALGKIVAYSLKSDGGEISGTCTIAPCIGRGGAWTTLPGDPTYVEAEYVDLGYQYMANARVVTGAGDVGFTPLLENANDDGLIFPLQAVPTFPPGVNSGVVRVVTEEKVPLAPVQAVTTPSIQKDDCGDITSASTSETLDTGPYTAWLGGIETTVRWDTISVEGGPFESPYPLPVTDLKLPKQIDLEAPSV